MRHLRPDSGNPFSRNLFSGNPISGNLAVLSAAVLWGTTGTAQALAPDGATPASIGSVRIVLGGLILCALFGGRLRRALARASWPLMAVGAVCVAAYQLCYFAAAARTGIAVGTVVTIGSGPVFAGLLARFTGGEPLTPRWMAATACAITGGAALLLGGEQARVVPAGVGLALAAGFGYATYTVVSSRLIRSGMEGRAVMAALFGGGALILLPVMARTDLAWAATPAGLIIAIHLGAVATAAGYLLYARGLRSTPVTTATTLVLAEPAVAALLGVVVVGERLGTVAVSGLALIGAGLLILARA